MDCGVITSKTVLLLLSLTFWNPAILNVAINPAVIAPVCFCIDKIWGRISLNSTPDPLMLAYCGGPLLALALQGFYEQAAAAGLSYVGGYVINTYKSYDNFLQDKYALLPAVIIICVAVVMFIIGLIGCCATFRESRVGLGLFLAIILVIFIAEVSAFVLGFVYREKVKTDVQGTMRSVFEKYDGKNPESTVVDYLQEQLHCCGVKNYSDWTTTQWFNSTGNNSVPLSCCRQDVKNCTGRLDQPQELNTRGCAEELQSGLQSVISYAMLVILGFAIVKFFGMLSVCVLTCKKEDSGYQPLYSGVFA